MAEVLVRVRDVCHRQGAETAQYTVQTADRKDKVDLCRAHATPVEQILAVVLDGAEPPAPIRRSKRTTVITTPEELERLRATGHR